MKSSGYALLKYSTFSVRIDKFIFIIFSFFAFLTNLHGQSYTSSNPGNFGIDGDVYSDTVLNGSFTSAGSHDWFLKPGGSGIGVFDTAGISFARQQINSGVNYGFSKKMQYARYSTLNGDLYLDGVYTRDYTGNGALLDKTAFNTSNTNNSAMDPTAWTTLTTGSSSIPGKVDIIDTYIHMRRLSSASNHIIAYLGASTMATSGNRYFDFEFYKSQIGYDTILGKFINSGPSSSGGHSAWTFNGNGSINMFGDLVLSFSFSSSAVSSIDIYIWVSYTTYSSIVPSGFDFTAGSWVGLSNNSGYGYAHIQAKAGNTLQAWGMVNTSGTSGPPWSGSYSAGQFAEAAIDLTNLGIDPLIAAGSDPCAPPYTRVLVKSRSSSSFSAALQDFVGPIIFLNASPLASIASSTPLSCSQTNQVLQPALNGTTTNYSWSTSNGSFTTRTDSGAVGINKSGTYYLNARSANCNNATADSIIVLQDLNKPVASANYTGVITSDPHSTVTLMGGDTTASKYNTSFGGSQGLLWSWTGPNGFTSSLENPTAKDTGLYTFTITEKRNGCSAIASTRVIYDMALELKIIQFEGKYDLAKKIVQLEWNTIDKSQLIQQTEVQKSFDGETFFPAGYIITGLNNRTKWNYLDKDPIMKNVYYRIKAGYGQSYIYSSVIKLNSTEKNASATAYLNTANQIALIYNSSGNENLIIDLINLKGILCERVRQQVSKGTTTITFSHHFLSSGFYFVLIKNGYSNTMIKIIL